MHCCSIPDQEKIRRQVIENAAIKGTDQPRSKVLSKECGLSAEQCQNWPA